MVKTPLPLQLPHKYAPRTTSTTISTATTTTGFAVPTNITAAATTATATGAMATWVGTDDELGLVPIMIKYLKNNKINTYII